MITDRTTRPKGSQERLGLLNIFIIQTTVCYRDFGH